MTPFDLKYYGQVSKGTLKEIADRIEEIYVEKQTKPDDDRVFLFRKGKEFVLDIVRRNKYPVPQKAVEIAEAYRNARLTRKSIEGVVKKVVEGKELSFDEQVLYVKALEKIDKYIDIFFNLLSLERIPSQYLLSPTLALNLKLPLPAFKFKKALTDKMKPLEGKVFPANAVLFLLTDLNVPEHAQHDKYLFLDRITVGLVHDDEELKKFPFKEKLDEKLFDTVRENRDFYILKQEIIAHQYNYFTISPAEFFAIVKNKAYPSPMAEEIYWRKRFFGEIIEKRYPNSPYLKKIEILIEKPSKTANKLPSM